MASRKPTLRTELAQYNQSLDSCLRTRYGMTLKLFKLVKGLTQLVGAGAGIYAMMLGAPPLAALMLTAIMVAGPETLEYLIERGAIGD